MIPLKNKFLFKKLNIFLSKKQNMLLNKKQNILHNQDKFPELNMI